MTETDIPVTVREIQMNWAAIPEHHQSHPFLVELRKLPRMWRLLCHLSWSPAVEADTSPEWVVELLRKLPIWEREAILAFVEGTGQDTTHARELLGL